MKEQQRKEHDNQCKSFLQMEAESTDRMEKKPTLHARKVKAMRQLSDGEEYGCVLISNNTAFNFNIPSILQTGIARLEQIQSFVDEFNRCYEGILAKTKSFKKEKKVRGVVHAVTHILFCVQRLESRYSASF
jgi:hypothetical protein